jgi:uncharacterized damage-inducible protein DinB
LRISDLWQIEEFGGLLSKAKGSAIEKIGAGLRAFFLTFGEYSKLQKMDEFRDLLVREVRRRLVEESVPRIKKCLAELTTEEIWYRPNENSNSVGNLVLHLCGNVRQWLLGGLGGYTDNRNRQQEFDERGPFPTSVLVRHLDELVEEVEKVLHKLNVEKILQPVEIQGFKENGVSVLVHVVEHFSYHTGQITYYVKWRKDINTQYYGGMNLNAVGRSRFD